MYRFHVYSAKLGRGFDRAVPVHRMGTEEEVIAYAKDYCAKYEPDSVVTYLVKGTLYNGETYIYL